MPHRVNPEMTPVSISWFDLISILRSQFIWSSPQVSMLDWRRIGRPPKDPIDIITSRKEMKRKEKKRGNHLQLTISVIFLFLSLIFSASSSTDPVINSICITFLTRWRVPFDRDWSGLTPPPPAPPSRRIKLWPSYNQPVYRYCTYRPSYRLYCLRQTKIGVRSVPWTWTWAFLSHSDMAGWMAVFLTDSAHGWCIQCWFLFEGCQWNIFLFLLLLLFFFFSRDNRHLLSILATCPLVELFNCHWLTAEWTQTDHILMSIYSVSNIPSPAKTSRDKPVRRNNNRHQSQIEWWPDAARINFNPGIG